MLSDNYPHLTTEQRESAIASIELLMQYGSRYDELGDVLTDLIADRMRQL